MQLRMLRPYYQIWNVENGDHVQDLGICSLGQCASELCLEKKFDPGATGGHLIHIITLYQNNVISLDITNLSAGDIVEKQYICTITYKCLSYYLIQANTILI